MQGGGAAANGHAALAFPPAAAPPGGDAKAAANGGPGGGAPLGNMQRRVVYGGVIQRLRALMVNRMAKPEVGARVRVLRARVARVGGWRSRALGASPLTAHCPPQQTHAPANTHKDTHTHTPHLPPHAPPPPTHTTPQHTHTKTHANTPPPPRAQEVIVVEDDNGNIVRETMKDNDVLAQVCVCVCV